MTLINLYHITPGRNLPLDTQATSFDELTRQLPQGYYSTFRTYDDRKRVLGLKAHLRRLYHPAVMQNIEPIVSSAGLRLHLTDILQNCPGEARVRMVMTTQGEIYIALSPLTPLPLEIYQHGVKVITVNAQRENPRLKATAFITISHSTRTQIAHSGIFEALLVKNDYILEGMTSNFFYVKDRVLGTARNKILLGVTRRTVLRVARGSGIDILYHALKRGQISALSEAFLTSSSRGVVPITQINENTVGEGIPGTVTKMLSDAYKEYVLRHAEIINFSASQS